MMSLLTRERRFLSSVASLGYGNPFLTERVTFERAALGREFVSGGPVWSASVSDPDAEPPNVAAIHEKLGPLMEVLPARLAAASDVRSGPDLAIYEECAHYLLYQRYHPRVRRRAGQRGASIASSWPIGSGCFRSREALRNRPAIPRTSSPVSGKSSVRFIGIYDNIIGNSMPAARLRASVWQSIFSHDMRRYRRSAVSQDGRFSDADHRPLGNGQGTDRARHRRSRATFRSTPSGWSSPMRRATAFLPINIAALSPTLIESELFGHRRGSFTGAIGDRKGWLEACPPSGRCFWTSWARWISRFR